MHSGIHRLRIGVPYACEAAHVLGMGRVVLAKVTACTTTSCRGKRRRGNGEHKRQCEHCDSNSHLLYLHVSGSF